jgi:hypothetical protein
MDTEEPQDDAAWIALEAKAEAHEEENATTHAEIVARAIVSSRNPKRARDLGTTARSSNNTLCYVEKEIFPKIYDYATLLFLQELSRGHLPRHFHLARTNTT